MDEIHILHRRNQEPFHIQDSGVAQVVVWSTCARQIALGRNLAPLKAFGDEVFTGWEAYRFFLEIVCGLHSPILGETEVLGQFKKFFENFVFPNNPWGLDLKRFVSGLLEDSKLVREKYLKNMGSQTYGSAVRKHLKGHDSVSFLGAGQLVQSILPWVEGRQVTVFCRQRHEGILKLQEKFPFIEILNWNQPISHTYSLICVAPISSRDLERWMARQKQPPELLIDLRENSAQDRVKSLCETIHLEDFFSEIRSAQSGLSDRLALAAEYIRILTLDRSNASIVRPFGWEDLCV